MATEVNSRWLSFMAIAILLTVGQLLPVFSLARTAHADPAPFLWGAATSSYQVEGGITCNQPGDGHDWHDLGFPCNDYDFFNGNHYIQDRVRINSGQVGPAFTLAPAGVADRFWEPIYYNRDFDNARMLGMNAFRISLEWARIEPHPGVFDESAIQHYRDMITAMRQRGLTPIVSLHHFTLPSWVLTPSQSTFCFSFCPLIDCFTICQAVDDTGYLGSLRGWEQSATVDAFIDYVQHVVPALKDLVDYWLTVNEPVLSQAVVGYVAGVWPAGYVSNGGRTKAVLTNLIEAHVRAYDAIKDCTNNTASCDDQVSPGGVPVRVGFAHAMGAATPAHPMGDNAEATRNFDYFANDYFVNAVVNGQEDRGYLDGLGSVPGSQIVDHPEWRNHLDFLGINYYRRFHVYFDAGLSLGGVGFVGGGNKNNLYGEGEPHGLLNDLGWEIYPQGLYELIMRAKTQWNMPVLITENGIPERADRHRAPYIVAHLQQVQRAIDDGAAVLGYLYWSLMDNWELQSNYQSESQFGLFHIDRNIQASDGSLLLHRELTEGALAYKQIIDESKVSSASGGPTAAALDSAQSKFGTLLPDGSAVVPPTKTHGRYWQGDGVHLYLGYTAAGGTTLTGLIAFGSSSLTWNRVELLRDSQSLILRERWFDDAAGAPAARDHRVTYANGNWSGTSGASTWSASRMVGTGLWQWGDDSPWGGTHFALEPHEGAYDGKYLTFATTAPANAHPTLPSWREFSFVQPGQTLRLHAGDPAIPSLDLFDVTLSFIGNDTATTVAVNSGTWTGRKGVQVVPLPFGFTGYQANLGDAHWGGSGQKPPTHLSNSSRMTSSSESSPPYRP